MALRMAGDGVEPLRDLGHLSQDSKLPVSHSPPWTQGSLAGRTECKEEGRGSLGRAPSEASPPILSTHGRVGVRPQPLEGDKGKSDYISRVQPFLQALCHLLSPLCGGRTCRCIQMCPPKLVQA